MASAYYEVSDALKNIIDTEFIPEGITATHDRLHESLGLESIEVGISPMRWAFQAGNATVKETWVLIQFYDFWEKAVDPKQQVDPRRITEFADRFERAIERHQNLHLGSSRLWYFEVRQIDFPNDPTGNKTRFEATVLARGDNTALLETRA